MGAAGRLSLVLLEGVVEMSIREKQGIHRFMCNTAVLLLIGMFVFAQQVSSESVFERGNALSPLDPVLDSPDLSEQDSVYTAADTMEIYDLMYDEDEGRNLYKEIAALTIVIVVVGYMLVTILKPDDDEAPTDDGKEPPITPALSVSVPLNR
jgi:hypothetical protein